MKWQTTEQLKQLLCRLVQYPSISGTEAEVRLAQYIADQLLTLDYFRGINELVQLHPTGDGRYFVTALVKKAEQVRDTVILLSHFDVVDVQDYGAWKDAAFSPEELTKRFYEQKPQLPADVQADMEAGEWLFGRGVMDMKCGLALHMALIEQACHGKFNGNLLLLTVPDEEANSAGMRAAVPVLVEMAEKYGLTYRLVLNSEPMFTRYPGDKTNYIYTGSIGKVLPGFYCYGKETHVGEPLAGLNANFMVSQIAAELELNTDFCEVFSGEVSPPPTNLWQTDLKEDYSVQIPHRAVTLFNLFLQQKSLDDVTSSLVEVAKRAAKRIEERYHVQASRFAKLEQSAPKSLSVRVWTFAELRKKAVEMFGTTKVEELETNILAKNTNKDEREKTIALVDQLAMLCKAFAPMIVLFYAPPYYPAVNSSADPLIGQLVAKLKTYAQETHGVSLVQQHYFGGISDLSYVGLQQSPASLRGLTDNMPLWNRGYDLPLDALAKFQVPVLNVGPVGRDAHQWTERLNVPFAFTTVKAWLEYTIKEVFAR
ncbi:Succinyl-diaminopimelate desuccinylase [Parageobacillus caldoxylosilyticus]|uniref:M20/M25/M40 family metallo-hydrolase n=1 Tax=Saccharococcus caldoxylosilyticus TaxID=81408 RepID=UPI001C4E0BB7|nr:M20/M25/M40 family metallo-hydrolase [Parageobacillus caldoxylosilyticus]QXJ38517.1 Succinyl-diaminopimelate desuccinylase [Parageobacillus caldoxylosilyticus]